MQGTEVYEREGPRGERDQICPGLRQGLSGFTQVSQEGGGGGRGQKREVR